MARDGLTHRFSGPAAPAEPLVFSWPVAALIIALIFRRPLLRLLDRFTASDQGKAEIGPIKIELGKLAEQGQEVFAL